MPSDPGWGTMGSVEPRAVHWLRPVIPEPCLIIMLCVLLTEEIYTPCRKPDNTDTKGRRTAGAFKCMSMINSHIYRRRYGRSLVYLFIQWLASTYERPGARRSCHRPQLSEPLRSAELITASELPNRRLTTPRSRIERHGRIFSFSTLIPLRFGCPTGL